MRRPFPLAVVTLLLAAAWGLSAGEPEGPVSAPVGEDPPQAELMSAECDGVSWPVGYTPAVEPFEPPLRCFGLEGAAAFPERRLPAVDVEALLEQDRVRAQQGEPLRVGIGRPLDVPLTGAWTDVPGGGRVWTAAIGADGATELRLHFTDVDLPPQAAIYVYSPWIPDRGMGPYTGTGPRQTGEFWAGTITGDTAYVEYYAPDGEVKDVPFRVDELGHMYRQPVLEGDEGLRGALDCMGDVACYPEWSDVARSVAKITMYSDGSWVSCTGTLLAAQNNDHTPYFLTSAHCLDTQPEADTIEFRWFYQNATCGGSLMTSQYTHDAEILDTSGYTGTPGVNTDWTLLMVKGVLPPGLFWSGWTTVTPPSGAWAELVHHPDGSWKRYSRGRRYSGGTLFHRIDFDVSGAIGAIYYGSSGGGIFNESDQKLYGNASFVDGEPGCDHLGTSGYYGRFALYYSDISSLLAAGSDDAFENNDSCAGATPVNSGSYPDLVVKDVDEDWYKLTVGYNDQLVVVLLFTDSYGNIDAELYDGCGGTVVASATSTSDNDSFAYTNPGPTADFYLRVYLADDTRNTYDMNISGAFVDCNNNGIPDECDASCEAPGCAGVPGCGQSPDCNGNLNPDDCDIADGISEDCNGNGIPDECSGDCNGNFVWDECELFYGTATDCNGNGVLDECDITEGTSEDCNGDVMPDECQLDGNDCNGNSVPDDCDSPDCNGNAVPDECDIAADPGLDLNANGIPDSCEAASRLECGVVAVGDSAVTVPLNNTYDSPVVVCSVRYDNNTLPVVTRVSNITPTSFDVRLQNPSGDPVATDNVGYVVIEEGVSTIDGVEFEAWTYDSTVVDIKLSWLGESRRYHRSHVDPVVLGQVMSENDPDWSVFWCQGAVIGDPPSPTELRTGKHVGADLDVTRAPETIGVIVTEAGHSTIGGVGFEARVGDATVQSVDNAPPYPYLFDTAFATAPTVAVVSQAGMIGTDGSWAQAYGPTLSSATTLNLSLDEDQLEDTERLHTPERVAYAVFEAPLVYPSAGDGDFDLDGDVDLQDYSGFQVCFDQSAGGGCQPGDMTGDGFIDAADIVPFVDALIGP